MQTTKTVLADSAQATLDGLVLVLGNRRCQIRWEDCSPLLAKASWEARRNMELSPGGYGIHWPQLDEDLSVNGLLAKV